MSQAENKSPYKLSISLNVLYHLGINLYSNVPAVLTELVANCWDADATDVEINIDTLRDVITIKDNGDGMDLADINGKFLNVGYEKRNDVSKVTELGRHVMGRKGIGKLSVFSIANEVEVHSIKNSEKNGFIMRIDDIKKKIGEPINKEKDLFTEIDSDNSQTETEQNKEVEENKKIVDKDYYPEPVEANKIKIDKGTLLILSGIKKSIATADKYLRKRLARRFTVIGEDQKFSVKLNNNQITIEDRDYFKNLEFIWYFGDDSKIYADKATSSQKKEKLSNVIDVEKDYKISGWVGTVLEQDNIEEDENIIVVHSHGKLVQEDILKDLKEEKLYTYYLMGEINADFLDDDSQDDIVTSDRQRIKEDDPRYVALKSFLEENVLKKEVKSNWEKWRREKGAEEIVKMNPVVGEWLTTLHGDNKKLARNLLGKINTFKIRDPKAKKELIKSTIIGFEKAALSNNLAILDKVDSVGEFEMIQGIFCDMDEIEATQYYQITKGRLEVIKHFKTITPESREAVLRDYIFDHLWLLHPSWERAASDFHVEESIQKEFDAITANLTDEEKAGRVDIRYRTAAGKNIIIELKKYDRKVNIDDLVRQVGKYRRTLEKCLKTQFKERPQIVEVICVLGSAPEPSEEEARNIEKLKSENARYITYNTLIDEAIRSYGDYLKGQKKVSELTTLIERI